MDNPEVWGPHYWFFINTIAFNYPEHPSDGMKKKYYNFITSLIDFIPNSSVASKFSEILDDYPVEPYLSSRESLLKWVHFIHNKINEKIGKKSIGYIDFVNNYMNQYKPNDLLKKELRLSREKNVFVAVSVVLFIIIVGLLKSH